MPNTYYPFQCGTEAMLSAQHDFTSHTFKAMFTNTLPDAAADTVIADITEISAGNGYSAGGVTLDNVSLSRTGGTTKVTIDDEVFTASGGTVADFRWVVIWNATTTGGPLVGFYDYGEVSGSPLSLQDGESITLDFDAAAGVITLALG